MPAPPPQAACAGTVTFTAAWLWFWPLAFNSVPVLTDECQGEGKALRGNYCFPRPTNKLFGSSRSTGSSSQSSPAIAAHRQCSSLQQSSPGLPLRSWSHPAWKLPDFEPSLGAQACTGGTGACPGSLRVSPGAAEETFPLPDLPGAPQCCWPHAAPSPAWCTGDEHSS